ncbi:MAG: hypothetical protein JWL83_2521 [Actinomycetia bacterium]|nr:hypothetical protein [Actinomycetes bacterium]
MRRRARVFLVGSVAVLLATPAVALSVTSAAPASGTTATSMCEQHPYMCTDTARHKNYEGQYSGHDEPAVAFYSNTPGSGNQATYPLTLPRDSAVAPTNDATGGTWNFQLHPAFWFGMILCDNQSSPEFTNAPCTPNSDKNIFDSPDPRAPDWIGHHPGSAFMEMQFYPPGWTGWPAGVSCTATQWCAALNVDSLNISDLTGAENNPDCLAKVSDEPVNFAFITKSGVAHAPASPLENSPLTSNQPGLTFNPATDMVMNPGDRVTVDMHDTAAGLTISLNDHTSGVSGSMTASTANGFAQVVFDPTAKTCKELPYAFHPQFSTSGPHTRAEWTAHSLNVSYSDEIGHFEYCNKVGVAGNCKSGGSATDPTRDADDHACFRASASLLVPINGCLDTDVDFDGPTYHNVWPGTGADPTRTAEPVRFTSPTFKHGTQYSQVAFETDLVNLERAFGYCTNDTLSACTVPPKGVDFYPMFTSGKSPSGGCEWREGGPAVPGAKNTFGGSATSEFGSVVATFYPIGPRATQVFYENFQRVLPNNPCQQ